MALTFSKAKKEIGARAWNTSGKKGVEIGEYLARGAEALVFKCVMLDDKESVIEKDLVLKLFAHNVLEREERARDLITSFSGVEEPELAGLPTMYIPQYGIGGSYVNAEVSYNLERIGQTFKTLTDYEKPVQQPTLEERHFLALSLCKVIEIFEKKGFVHGDIAAGNIFCHLNGGDSYVAPIDYGNHSFKGKKLLPVVIKDEKKRTRKIRAYGTAGYQYPDINEALKKGKDVFVQTDRFAMACLICELMLWKKNHEKHLKREELFTQEWIQNRSIRKLERRIYREWPEAFDLISSMLKKQPNNFPTPSHWRRLIESFYKKNKPQVSGDNSSETEFNGAIILCVSNLIPNTKFKAFGDERFIRMPDGECQLDRLKDYPLEDVTLNIQKGCVTLSGLSKKIHVLVNRKDQSYPRASKVNEDMILIYPNTTVFVGTVKLRFETE